jgi:transcriptional regulator with XRE-family HTH domain
MQDSRSSSRWKGLPTLLRAARKRAGITTVRAAEALDVRRPAIWEMEHGKRRVSAEELAKLADLYDVSATWLLERASSRARDDRAELAAQELARMSDADLDRLSAAIKIVRERRSPVLNMPGIGQR